MIGRPPRRHRLTLGTLGLAVVGVWATAIVVLGPVPPADEPPPSRDVPPSTPPDEPLAVFARVEGIALRLPAPGSAVAYHEASYPDALRLQPRGRCAVCRNAPKFRPPPPSGPDLGYIVMDGRGRPQSATSAVDLVVAAGTDVRSLVTGIVRKVERYRLYWRYPDVRVEIRPAGAPERRVVIIHLQEVRVGPGDRVLAGETVLGRPRPFPFRSQVDRYVGGGHPHIHVEVKRHAARRPAR